MSRWKKIILIADDFVSLLFPRLCQACGEPLVRNEKLICLSCLLDIPLTNYHMQRNNSLEKSFYGRCYIEKAAAWAFYRQGAKVQKLIHQLKYAGVRPVGKYLGRLYGNVLRDSDFSCGIDCITAVPLHHSKRRKRGFNQSRLIAEGMAAALDIPYYDNILVRRFGSDTQTSKHRYDRWKNVENIFVVKRAGEIAGKHILLVDDVITTGSTIEACATELLKIKDVRVSVAAIAAAEK
ncbi:MAG: ComF family protein [Bacteroidales bacterium]|nr:ComF family protein [Bacteroidales bacterium]